jgi:glucose/arabinose dehydrogenase
VARRALAVLLAVVGIAGVGAVPAAGAPRFHCSLGGVPLVAPVTDMAATPSGRGYWMVAEDGGVFSFGDARFFGSTGGLALAAPVIGMAPTPSGRGYWLVAQDGGVFAFGDARFFGSAAPLPLFARIVAMAPTATGAGYWLVAEDGGVFAFGDARFFGSLGGRLLGTRVSDIVSTPAGDGYWIVRRNGVVSAFGAARHRGDLRALSLVSPVTELVPTPSGRGYWLVAEDGGVFTFGDARFHGSAGGAMLAAPVVGFDTTPTGDGYWMAARDGGVFTFPGPAFGGSRPPLLEVHTVAAGLSGPWDVGFLPDRTLVFTERPGRISAVVGGGVRLLAVVPDVRVTDEGGLLGLAVDPAFASNRRVYTCFASTAGDVKVVEWEVARALDGLRRVRDLVGGIPQGVTGRHSGCRVRFGNDGFLWISTGDTAVGTRPQDLADLGGKVLRVDQRTGGPAPGNPFGSRVYTFGHRNPQGLAFRPASPHAFSVEHGPVGDDEVNRLVAGANYGWDPVPGYDESVPMTDTAKFPTARGPVWRSGAARIAPSGATFLSGPQWGTWNGVFVFAALRGQQLRLLQLTADGESYTSDQIVLTGFGRLRTPVQGPDGALYVTTSNGSGVDRILRIVPR